MAEEAFPAISSPSTSTSASVPGFAFPKGLTTGYIPTAVVNGDFNEDGKMDVAICNGGDNTVYVYMGNGDGTFQVPEVLYTKGQSPDWMTTAKLHAGGHLDLVVSNADSQTVEVFTGKGDGTFSAGAIVSTPAIPTLLVRGDFNNDGKDDIAVGLMIDPGVHPQFEILLGNGAGGFSGTIVSPTLNNGGEESFPTTWLEAGDVDNNGYLDILTTIQGVGSISYLNVDGTKFTKATSFFGSPFGTTVMGLGDLDEDGCMDAVESDGFGFVTVRKGNCDGTFASVTPQYPGGDIDVAIKLMDIDGDGHLDVVATSAWVDGVGPNTAMGDEAGYLVSVMRGDGKGHLAPVKLYRANGEMYSFVVADFNGDGKPDLVATHATTEASTYMPGLGSGKFNAPEGANAGMIPGPTNAFVPTDVVHVVDVNGDKHPDLLLVELGPDGTSTPSTFAAFLNDGQGHFAAPVKSPITVGMLTPNSRFATGDFRNTGKPDIIYFSVNSQSLAFFPNTGNGSFGAPVPIPLTISPFYVTTGDFNHDGKLDFVILGGSSTAMWAMFLGNGDGTFRALAPQSIVIPENNGVQQIVSADFNHDGKLDVLLVLDGQTNYMQQDVLEVLGNGDGTFQAPKIVEQNTGWATVADVNNDGLPDLIQNGEPGDSVVSDLTYRSKAGFTVYLGQPDGTFGTPVYYPLSGHLIRGTQPILVGDFNGDGNLDLAMRTLPDDGRYIQFQWMEGHGDGTFTKVGVPLTFPNGSAPSAVGDLNGDGKDDLVELVGFTTSYDTINAVAGPGLQLTFSSSPVVNATGHLRVTLARPASAAEDVTITTDSAGITVPGSVHFASGEQAQDFTFSVGSTYNHARAIHIVATLGSEAAEVIAAMPNANAPFGVYTYVSPQQLVLAPGQQYQLQYGLQSEGGYSGDFTGFGCSGVAGSTCDFAYAEANLLPGGIASTPLMFTASNTPGNYTLTVSSSDGVLSTTNAVAVKIETYSLSAPSPMVSLGPTDIDYLAIAATAPSDFASTIFLTCSGLPSGASCVNGYLTANTNANSPLQISTSGVAAKDYPFQVVGTVGTYSQTVNATLRVGDFTGSVSPGVATLSVGQQASFTVTLNSVNHYAAGVIVTVESSPGATASSNEPQIQLQDGGTATGTLTLQLTSFAKAERPRLPWMPGGVTLCAIPMMLLFRRKWRVVSLLLIAFVAGGLVSCGGGGSNGGSGGGARSAQLRVKATAMNGVHQPNAKYIGTITVSVK